MTEKTKEQIETAYGLYKSGMKLVDIAKALKRPDSTIRRWKRDNNWCNLNEPIAKKNERTQSDNKAKRKSVNQDINQVLANNKLTYKQQLFCLCYVRCFSAVKAYQKAYECTPESAMSNAHEVFNKKYIQDEINKLKHNKFSRLLLTEEDIFQKYVDIAFSDMTDYVEFKGNKLSLRDSSEVDGTLIDEISTGKMGVKFKLADRMKALEWLTNHMNIATDDQKLKIEYMQEKVECLKKANEKADDTESFNITIVDADKI